MVSDASMDSVSVFRFLTVSIFYVFSGNSGRSELVHRLRADFLCTFPQTISKLSSSRPLSTLASHLISHSCSLSMYSPRDDTVSRLVPQLSASRREGSEVSGDGGDVSRHKSEDLCKLRGPDIAAHLRASATAIRSASTTGRHSDASRRGVWRPQEDHGAILRDPISDLDTETR
jgi:hypothetical protein